MKKKLQWLLMPQNLSVVLWIIFALIFTCSNIYGAAIQNNHSAILDSKKKEYEYLRYMIISIFVTFAGIVFVGLWRNATDETKEDSNPENVDYGLAWLTGAMIFWALQALYGLLGFYYGWSQDANRHFNAYNNLKPLFSSVNSACFIASIFFFDYRRDILEFKPIKGLIHLFKITITRKKSKRWAVIYVVVSAAIVFLIHGNININLLSIYKINLSALIDAIFLGIPTIGILTIVLCLTWIRRGYTLIAFLSGFILLATLIIQFTNSSEYFAEKFLVLNTISLILYKILLSMIFFALAFSWSQDKAEHQIGDAKKHMTHIIKDSLILLNNDFQTILINEDDKIKSVFQPLLSD